MIVKFQQRNAFSEEIKILHDYENFDDVFKLSTKSQRRRSDRLRSLRKLSPVVVNELLYVGGRLHKFPLTVEANHQMILHTDHYVTKLVIRYFHENEGHCGTLHELSAVRERFRVIKGQVAVRKTLIAEFAGSGKQSPESK